MKQRILYIEDNPHNMDLVCRILSHVGGYEVSGAVDGFSGVASAEQLQPDLIIMDINLPDINGLEVTRRIKAKPQLQNIPIIAFTADTGESDRQIYLAAGCNGYMAKPASAKTLLDTVQQFL